VEEKTRLKCKSRSWSGAYSSIYQLWKIVEREFVIQNLVKIEAFSYQE
jgi:hypothetical protein